MATFAAAEAFQAALLDDDPAALYDKAPCGYLSTSPDGTISKVNTTFLTWTGYTIRDLVGQRRLVDLLTPGGRIYHETHLSPILHGTSQAKEIALEMVRADGGRMPVLVNAVLDRTAAGDPKIVRYALFDATERRRYEQELLKAKTRAEESERHAVRLAKTLQQTLIPPTSPYIPDLEVASAYRPAGSGDEVGGDFYDLFQLGEGDWVVALGDVAGKGVEAAVVTALVRHSIRALAVVEPSPQALLHRLNAILLASEPDRFCTVVVMRLRQRGSSWEVTVGAGGHPLPLLLRPGRPPEPVGQAGTFVGAFDDAWFADSTVMLQPGDSLFLHTDGVTEARRDGEFFGDERLLQALVAPDAPASLIVGLLEQVLEFQRQVPRDDIALLVVRVPA